MGAGRFYSPESCFPLSYGADSPRPLDLLIMSQKRRNAKLISYLSYTSNRNRIESDGVVVVKKLPTFILDRKLL